MTDQRVVPEAFMDAHRDDRGRLTLGWEALVSRHEWCEDLCQALLEQVQWLQHDHGITPDELASRVIGSLSDPTLMIEAERQWAQARLAELLGP